jgi:peptidylprolyl isomerase
LDSKRDYYSILQVPHGASQEQIQRAFERLSRQYDPATSKKSKAAQRHQEVVEAYETLSDKKLRADYDRALGRSRIPGAVSGDGTISRPYFLAGALGAAVIAVVVVIVVAVLAATGDDESVAVIETSTPTPEGQTPAPTPTPGPTPEGQTPAPTPPATPPDVTGETVTTESGLQYIDITIGTGPAAVPGDSLAVDYTGWTQADNQLFDSSIGRTPFTLVLGAGEVIDGWDEGLVGMQQGGMRRLIIPPDLAYGETGQGSIPPNATLIFDVTLVTLTPASQ